jgi:HEAT repeat protein
MSEVESLIETLKDQRESIWHARQQAVEKLGKIDDPRVNGELTKVFMEDPVPQVRNTAKYRLNERDSAWRESEAVKAMIPTLITRLNDDSSEVRYAAADALAELKPAGAVSVLVTMLSDELHSRRELAERTLRQIGTSEAEAALADHRNRQNAASQVCPQCKQTTSVERITDYVQGRVCRSCGWASVWCYECKTAPMTATPEFWNRPGMPVQAWLNCEGCGKRSRADDYILRWLRDHKLI